MILIKMFITKHVTLQEGDRGSAAKHLQVNGNTSPELTPETTYIVAML